MRAAPRTCRRSGGAPFLESLVLAGPPSRTGPTDAEQTDGRCIAWRLSAGSRATRGTAGTGRRRIVGAATTSPASVRLPRGRTRRHWDSMTAAASGTG